MLKTRENNLPAKEQIAQLRKKLEEVCREIKVFQGEVRANRLFPPDNARRRIEEIFDSPLGDTIVPRKSTEPAVVSQSINAPSSKGRAQPSLLEADAVCLEAKLSTALEKLADALKPLAGASGFPPFDRNAPEAADYKGMIQVLAYAKKHYRGKIGDPEYRAAYNSTDSAIKAIKEVVGILALLGPARAMLAREADAAAKSPEGTERLSPAECAEISDEEKIRLMKRQLAAGKTNILRLERYFAEQLPPEPA
jgi:hypothetical protein